MIRTVSVVLFFLSVVPNVWAANRSANSDIVASFFPDALAREAAHDETLGIRETRQQSSVAIPEDRRYVFAAYSNQFSGAVRMIRVDADSPVLAGEGPSDSIHGSDPQVRAVDFDRDGHSELIAEFTRPTGTRQAWIFSWDGAHLTSIGPCMRDAELGTVRSLLTDIDVLDVNGDGHLEVIDHKVREKVITNDDGSIEKLTLGELTLYRLQDGRFESSGQVTDLEVFVRGKGAPRTEVRPLQVNASGDYLLRVLNGPNGTPVSSAAIAVNNVEVVREYDLNKNVPFVERRVTLRKESVVSASLRGDPGSDLIVLVVPAPSVSP